MCPSRIHGGGFPVFTLHNVYSFVAVLLYTGNHFSLLALTKFPAK
jgi:hypothetical protein